MLTALPTGDDLAIVLFFAAGGLAFMIPAVQEKSWKRWLFGCLCALSFLCALFWPTIKGFSPALNSVAVILVHSTIFHFGSGFVVGFAMCAWLRALLDHRRRAGSSGISHENPAVPNIDRKILAQKAEDLHAKILALVGEHEGRIRAAWIEDCRSSDRDGSKHADAKGYLLQQYALRFSIDVEAVVNQAKKIMSLNRDDHWIHFRGGASRTDVAEIATYMAKLATELRHPQPDIPMHSPFLSAHKAAIKDRPDEPPLVPAPPQPRA